MTTPILQPGDKVLYDLESIHFCDKIVWCSEWVTTIKPNPQNWTRPRNKHVLLILITTHCNSKLQVIIERSRKELFPAGTSGVLLPQTTTTGTLTHST